MHPPSSSDYNFINLSLSMKIHDSRGVKHLYPVSPARDKQSINARISRALIAHRHSSLRSISHQLLKSKIEKSIKLHLERKHYYHNASEHGTLYRLLNEILHLIVLIYRLYGLIRFEVKFVHLRKLVRFIYVYLYHITVTYQSS